MSTPLQNPITINLVLETQEDLLALFLRANLTPDDLREFYYDVRDKDYVIPDVRTRGLWKALKTHMEREGVTHIATSCSAPGAAVAPAETVRMG